MSFLHIHPKLTQFKYKGQSLNPGLSKIEHFLDFASFSYIFSNFSSF